MWLRDKSVPQSSVRVEQVRDVLEMFEGFGDLSSWSGRVASFCVTGNLRNQVGSGYPWIAAHSSLGGTISPSHNELGHQHFVRAALGCACKTSLNTPINSCAVMFSWNFRVIEVGRAL